MNMMKVVGDEFPEYISYQMSKIFLVLEDVYSVGSIVEIQEAIDSIGTGAGTIFIEAGTYDVTVPINIDNCGSIVIYGHGDNTVLRAADGVTVFNITCCASLLIKTLKIDGSLYTAPSINVPLVIVNENLDNVVGFSDVTIEGLNNFGRGIELQSNNCLIQHCNISLLSYGINITSDHHIITQNTLSINEIGIYHAGSYCNITGNTCNSNTNIGIYIAASLYSNISNNTCNFNPTGISVNASNHNTISNNISSSNTFYGIYMILSNYNTLSGNTTDNNNSNSAMNTGGIYLGANCDFNTISANSSNNNNNIGAGDAYGIIIAAVTCDENVIVANNANGNDIDWKDAGTRTVIKYYVQDEEELQDAIDSIETRAGTIIITNGTLSITATINVDGGGDYVITGEGVGSVLETVGDITCFNVTSAKSCVLKDFKIDATSLTALLKEIINIDEGSDNKIICENLVITGDGTHGLGVSLSSNNCLVTNCFFEKIKAGVFTSNSANNIISENICKNCDNGINNYFGSDCIITGNVCSNNTIGIFNDRSTDSTIVENTCNHNSRYGIFNYGSSDCTITGNACNGNNLNDVSDGAGIHLTDDCDYNIVSGNSCNNNANAGAGTAYGINIDTVDCNKNIIGANSKQNNDVDYNDTGTGTVLFGDDTVYGISWDTNLGTATKNAIYDKIQLVIAGAAANAFKTITGITNDVVADGVADTLTFVVGAGLTIVGTTATDTITFTNTITQYTDAMVEAVITAELAAGESIDNRIDALLTANADGYITALEAIAAVLADDAYVKLVGDVMGGNLTVPNIICAGLVDGVDVSDLKDDVDGFQDALKNLTAGEIAQLENIGAELISAAEWGFVASLQDVASGASPNFNRITINNVGTVNSDAVRYDQMMSLLGGLNWQEAVLDNDLTDPPGGEGVGDRYIVAAVAGGAWTGHEDDIAEYNGAGWDFTTPEEGFTVWVLDEDTNFTYNGVAWVEFGSTISHNNTTGLQGGVAGEYFHLTNAQIAALHSDVIKTVADVEAIITAELVNGQSIDNRIDALLTNNADGYQNQAGVEAIITAELVDGQSIDNRIDALLADSYGFKTIDPSTGENVVADAESDTLNLVGGGDITVTGVAATDTITIALTKYTDVEVQNVITAELVDGQSIDNRIDVLIAGLVNAAGAVAAVEAAGLDFDTTKTLGFVDDVAGVFIDRIYDEDDMASDDEHGLATQQSIKKYSDDRLYDIGFSHNWGGIVDKAPTVDKVYDQFIEVANEMTAIKYCLNFQGVWNAALGAAPNPAPADGDYWIVTTAGVWDGITWELLDWIVWENNTEKWYKVKYFRSSPRVSVKPTESIQTAIDKVIYMGGGIVEIESGTFNDGVDVYPLNINDGGAGLFLKIIGIGDSTIIDSNADSTVFNITNIGKLVLEDFKIDANDLTTPAKEIISITETNNNPVIIERITIVGDGVNGYGIAIHSDNCIMRNNTINNVYYGISLDSVANNIISDNFIDSCNHRGIYSQTSNNNKYNGNICENNGDIGILIHGNNNNVSGNKCNNNTSSGIYLYGSYNTLIGNICNSNTIHGIENDQSSYGTIVGNTCNNNIGCGIFTNNCTTVIIVGNECYNNCEGYVLNAGGIWLAPSVDYCNVSGNVCGNNTNTTGGVDGHGIRIQAATCDNNIISSNVLYGNDINFLDNGTTTIIFGDNTAYGASWEDDLGTATKHTIWTKIEAVIAGIPAAYTDADADARIVVQNTDPAGTIDIAIDALINTHNVADNHIAHSGVTITAGVGLSGGGTIAANRTIDCDITQYTDAMVENVITAELVNGQSIDNRIDTLISAAVHTRLHAMTDVLDHYANYWKLFYSDATGQIQEIATGVAGTILTGNGIAAAPSFQAAAADPLAIKGHETLYFSLKDSTIISAAGAKLDAVGDYFRIVFYVHANVDDSENLIFSFITQCIQADAAVTHTKHIDSCAIGTETINWNIANNVVWNLDSTVANRHYKTDFIITPANYESGDSITFQMSVTEAGRDIRYNNASVEYTRKE